MLELWKKPIFVITDILCNSSASNDAEELQDRTSNSFKQRKKPWPKEEILRKQKRKNQKKH
jgi:hypothetical protein